MRIATCNDHDDLTISQWYCDTSTMLKHVYGQYLNYGTGFFVCPSKPKHRLQHFASANHNIWGFTGYLFIFLLTNTHPHTYTHTLATGSRKLWSAGRGSAALCRSDEKSHLPPAANWNTLIDSTWKRRNLGDPTPIGSRGDYNYWATDVTQNGRYLRTN